MINLPLWVLNEKFPSIYDSESATAIEMTSKLYGAMREIVNEYNSFATEWNQKINEFMDSTDKDFELFRVSMRQEFQDFIDIINLKYQGQERIIEESILDIKTNLSSSILELTNEMLNSGVIRIETAYDSESESLNIVVGGELNGI